MKRLILLLFLFVGLTYGQNFMLKVTPTISTTIKATDATTATDTLKAHTAGGFDSVKLGMRVVGTSIPFGSYVTQLIDTSTIRINAKVTGTISNASVQYGFFTSEAYAAGDAMGFPFTLQPFRQIKQIIVEDDDKQITSVDMVFFDTTFTETKDTAAFAPSDFDARRIVGYVTVGGSGYAKALSLNEVMVLPFTSVPLQFSVKKLYCQLIAVGTPTFTTSSSLHITFIGE
jgi:hypothetical protein